MDLTKPCYFFFDFDGTVAQHGMPIPENVEMMNQVRAMGHKLILNTGRSKGHFFEPDHPERGEIPWDGMIFGASQLVFDGKTIEKKPISFFREFAWFRFCLKHRYGIMIEGEKGSLDLRYDRLEKPLSFREKIGEYRKFFHEVFTDPQTKISIHRVLDPAITPKRLLRQILQHKTYAEVFRKGADKGLVIKRFCELLNIPMEQCACFGDSMNDYPMFRVCPISVCMRDSSEELAKISTYHAKTEFGVAEGLKWILESCKNA